MNTNKTYIDAVDMGATINGAAIDMRGLERLGVEASWDATDTPTGTLKLQASYDHEEGAPSAATCVASGHGRKHQRELARHHGAVCARGVRADLGRLWRGP